MLIQKVKNESSDFMKILYSVVDWECAFRWHTSFAGELYELLTDFSVYELGDVLFSLGLKNRWSATKILWRGTFVKRSDLKYATIELYPNLRSDLPFPVYLSLFLSYSNVTSNYVEYSNKGDRKDKYIELLSLASRPSRNWFRNDDNGGGALC